MTHRVYLYFTNVTQNYNDVILNTAITQGPRQ